MEPNSSVPGVPDPQQSDDPNSALHPYRPQLHTSLWPQHLSPQDTLSSPLFSVLLSSLDALLHLNLTSSVVLAGSQWRENTCGRGLVITLSKVTYNHPLQDIQNSTLSAGVAHGSWKRLCCVARHFFLCGNNWLSPSVLCNNISAAGTIDRKPAHSSHWAASPPDLQLLVLCWGLVTLSHCWF